MKIYEVRAGQMSGPIMNNKWTYATNTLTDALQECEDRLRDFTAIERSEMNITIAIYEDFFDDPNFEEAKKRYQKLLNKNIYQRCMYLSRYRQTITYWDASIGSTCI